MPVLLEPDVKALLAGYGIPVPEGVVCATPQEARDAARGIGPALAVKAIVPTGRKGKAGGVQLVEGVADATAAAERLLGSHVRGFPVDAVLVERRQAIVAELYVAVLPDGDRRTWRLLFSATGGVDIEEAGGDGVHALPLDPGGRVYDFEVRRLVKKAGIAGPGLRRIGAAVAAVARAAIEHDATLLEVNPLAVCADGSVCVIGAIASVDENALHRHPQLAARVVAGVDRVGRPLTGLEQHIESINERYPDQGHIRFSEFADGDLGFMFMGGGAGLVALDELMRRGGRPATFFDMTAGDVEDKIYEATSAILGIERIRGLIVGVNISAFAPVPIRVRGIARALRESGRDFVTFPVVLRLAGPDDEEGAGIMREFADVWYFRDELTIEEAVAFFVEQTEKVSA